MLINVIKRELVILREDIIFSIYKWKDKEEYFEAIEGAKLLSRALEQYDYLEDKYGPS